MSSTYRARHAQRSPWRWLTTLPPAAGLIISCMLMAWPAAASAAPAAPLSAAAMMTEPRVQQLAAPGLPVRQVDAAITVQVLARREAALDRRQAARRAARRAAAEAAALAARKAAARAARQQAGQQQAAVAPATSSSPPSTSTPAGDLSYSQLEALWVSVGGPSWAAPQAAQIAICESGGNPDAENPSGASGLWQILGQVVPGNIFDPTVNAENAVSKFNSSGQTFAQWVCQ